MHEPQEIILLHINNTTPHTTIVPYSVPLPSSTPTWDIQKLLSDIPTTTFILAYCIAAWISHIIAIKQVGASLWATPPPVHIPRWVATPPLLIYSTPPSILSLILPHPSCINIIYSLYHNPHNTALGGMTAIAKWVIFIMIHMQRMPQLDFRGPMTKFIHHAQCQGACVSQAHPRECNQ